MYLSTFKCPWFGRDRIVVSTLRCGRNNPGSNPGHGMSMSYHGREDIYFWMSNFCTTFAKNTPRPGIEPGSPLY